jgi:hypothetical protein
LLVWEKVSNFERRLYPCLQIFGGGMLVLSTVNQLQLPSNGATILASVLLGLVGILGMILAVRWFEAIPSAAKWCFVFWVVQVPLFSTSFASFTFLCGAGFNAVIDLSPIGFNIYAPRLGILFNARVEPTGPTPYIGINMVALAAAAYFWRAWQRESVKMPGHVT